MTCRVSITTGICQSVKSPPVLFIQTLHVYSRKNLLIIFQICWNAESAKKIPRIAAFKSPLILCHPLTSRLVLWLCFWSYVSGQILLEETKILAKTKFKLFYVHFAFPATRKSKDEKRKISRIYAGYMLKWKSIIVGAPRFRYKPAAPQNQIKKPVFQRDIFNRMCFKYNKYHITYTGRAYSTFQTPSPSECRLVPHRQSTRQRTANKAATNCKWTGNKRQTKRQRTANKRKKNKASETAANRKRSKSFVTDSRRVSKFFCHCLWTSKQILRHCLSESKQILRHCLL